MANDILIVDDEADIRDLVAGILDDEGFTTRTARDSDSALAEIANRRPNMVFLDIWLQGSKLDGLQLLEQVKRDNPELPVVMISGHGNIETAVAAIKRGAYDFIEKPFKADRLILVATRALETSRLKREVKELKQLAPVANSLTGRSAAMNQLRQTIDRAAKANSRILIVGPSGAGKELAARTLHTASARSTGPFVVINAAAITPERMEVELFGIEQSNGEQARKAGALEEAHGGTLFIDEIGDLPRETQNKILRVLVDQTFMRAGAPPRSMSTSASSRRPRVISKRKSPKVVSVRISIIASRWCRSACRRCPSTARISRSSSNISWSRSRSRRACRSGRLARTPWPSCSPMSGRAISASFATTSNAS